MDSIPINNRNEHNQAKETIAGEAVGDSASDDVDARMKDEAIFDLIKRRYDGEVERRRFLDGKAGNLIGYVTIVTGLLVGLGTFDILGKLFAPQYYLPYFGGIGLLLFSLITSLWAMRIQAYDTVPAVKDLEDRNILNDKRWKYRSVIRQAITGMSKTIVTLEAQNMNKAKWIEWSWRFLVVGIILIVFYVIIFTTTSGNLK